MRGWLRVTITLTGATITKAMDETGASVTVSTAKTSIDLVKGSNVRTITFTLSGLKVGTPVTVTAAGTKGGASTGTKLAIVAISGT